jgi:HPt (histidine-containing phosphotransfer) domain-containing protein
MIDWDRVAALKEEVGTEDFDEVIELFLMEVDEEIDALNAVPPGVPLQEKLHFLKGSALSLGFSQFSNLCQSGEAALQTDPAAQVDLGAICDSYQSSRETFLSDLPNKLAG